MQQLNYTSISDSKTGRSVRLSTWTEDGEWWVRITVNGVDRTYESLGPVEDEPIVEVTDEIVESETPETGTVIE